MRSWRRMNQNAIATMKISKPLRQQVEAEGKMQEPELVEPQRAGDGENDGGEDRDQDHGGEDEGLDLMAVAGRIVVDGNLCRHVAPPVQDRLGVTKLASRLQTG